MINKTKHLLRALRFLPSITGKSQATLSSPHWVVDYNTKRNICDLAVKNNINTYITTKLDPRNENVHVACRAYHVFRIDGDRCKHPNLGKKREFVLRPRPLVPIIAITPKEYRRHNGGH
jgi:hypothetical protein